MQDQQVHIHPDQIFTQKNETKNELTLFERLIC